MTPDERDLISGLFSRLKTADAPNKDRDADELIRNTVAAFPAAPYLLTQTVLVQEQALKSAESHIASLEQQLADAEHAAQQQSSPSSGSFLSRVRRPWETPSQQTPQPTPQPAAQPAYAPQPAYAAPSASGGFLHSALSTAAGVAGGALLFSGIERLLGYRPGPFSGYGGFGGFGGLGGLGGAMGSPWGGASTPVENVTVNNYNTDDGRDAQTAGDDQFSNDQNTSDSNASDDTGGRDSGGDFGGDSGGGTDI